MVPLCKLIKRGVGRAYDLTLSNKLEACPDSSVGRALTYNVGVTSSNPVRVGYFSHFHFSYIYVCVCLCVCLFVCVCIAPPEPQGTCSNSLTKKHGINFINGKWLAIINSH